jgi:glycopeptide antibiotics resistance protein
VYLLIVAFIVFFLGNDYRFYHVFSAFGSINIIPLKDKYIFLRHPELWGGNNMRFFLKELFGNWLLLFPFPFILMLIEGVKSKRKIIFYSFLLSLSIEALQFLTGLGNADIDDILLNTLGALIGAFFSGWIRKQKFWLSIQSALGMVKY